MKIPFYKTTLKILKISKKFGIWFHWDQEFKRMGAQERAVFLLRPRSSMDTSSPSDFFNCDLYQLLHIETSEDLFFVFEIFKKKKKKR